MKLNVITADRKTSADKQKSQLSLELAEIREISEMMFVRLEKKMQQLQALEAEADRKIKVLERLLERSGAPASSDDTVTNRRQEILALSQKGLAHQEIAEVLDMPRGEVELVLALTQPQRDA